MSLRHLLSISRTVAAVEERPGRFRVLRREVLPRFNRSDAEPSNTPDSNPGSPPARPESGRELGRRTSNIFAAVPDTSSRGGPEHASAGFRMPRWVEQILLSLLWPGNRRRGTRPVQTEMPFDTVKVARNDLMTADVEVIVKPKRLESGLSPACRGRVLRLWWGESARRLRKLSNTLF